MGKSIFELYPKESWEHLVDTDLWRRYVNYFGEEINSLFGDNYIVKIRFGHFYKEVINGQYHIALKSLRGYKENFVSDYDLKLYDKFEQLCLNIDNMKSISKGDWIKNDFNNYYLVINGDIDKSLIKLGFNSKFQFRNTLISNNNFDYKRTSLHCFRNLTEDELSEIKEYFNNNRNAYDELIKYNGKYFDLCLKLKEKGFVESLYNVGYFNKILTSNTALVINIKDYGKYIGLVYGITTVSDAEEYRNFFDRFGKPDDEITLRKSVSFVREEDETKAQAHIQDFLLQYKDLSKEELLLVSKENRKKFINAFNVLLKPLGFKKKSNKWSKDINDRLVFNFYLSKSQYSDIYYMDTWINSKDNENEISYKKRYLYQNHPHIDWQLIDMNDFNIYLKEVFIKEIEIAINNNM